MGNYSEMSSSTEVNASEPCSVHLKHSLKLQEDREKLLPASNVPFILNTPNGIVKGKLNSSGEAIIKNVGIGKVTVEYEPKIDKEIALLQQEIKKELDMLVREEQLWSDALSMVLKEQNFLEKTLAYTGALLEGAYKGVKGLLGMAWDTLIGAGKVLYHASLYMNPLIAPETFKQDLKVLKETYKELEHFADEDLELYLALMSDKKTYEMMTSFASDYIDAQHTIEWVSGAGESVPAIIIAIFTLGGGAVAGAANGSAKIVQTAQKLKPLFGKLKELFKRRLFKKRVTGETNRKLETEGLVIRQDDNFKSKTNKSEKLKSYIDEDGTLRPANEQGIGSIQNHVRGANPHQTPYTATTILKEGVRPKKYGKNMITIDTKKLQKDIDLGKIKDVEIISPEEVQKEIKSKLNKAQIRYDNNPTPKNAEKLDSAKNDLGNTTRDNECLIKGCIPKEYIKEIRHEEVDIEWIIK